MKQGCGRFWRWRLGQVQNERTNSTPVYAELVEALLCSLKSIAARENEQPFDRRRTNWAATTDLATAK